MCISHKKNLTSQKLNSPLGLSGLKSFHGFVILGERMVPIAFLVFYLAKVVGSSSLENLYRKPYRTWPMAVKTFKKHLNGPTGAHKKSQILLTRFIDEYRGKEVPRNKVFDSIHKERIKKAREAITPIVDTLKLYGR